MVVSGHTPTVPSACTNSPTRTTATSPFDTGTRTRDTGAASRNTPSATSVAMPASCKASSTGGNTVPESASSITRRATVACPT